MPLIVLDCVMTDISFVYFPPIHIFCIVELKRMCFSGLEKIQRLILNHSQAWLRTEIFY